ncbi:MAG: hypothetical protein NTV80_27100 [Verrucomicrobia bacterium]|nr:hypothetical protein [Verrucomicrobiota bacterium]
MKLVFAILLLPSVLLSAETPPKKPKPAFQYESGEIKVSLPTAEEPKVKQFGAESIQAAAKYLEDGAISWVREKSCVNCHTTGPYLSERPALIPQLGQVNEEILADFIDFTPKEIKEVKVTSTPSGHRHYPAAFTSVWRSLGLAEWDKHVNGKTGEHTERSIRDMFERQSASGAFVSHGEVEIPHITTDFELTLQAARVVTAAPAWLANQTDEKILAKVSKLKAWLKQPVLKNDFDRVLQLQLASYMPELVTAETRVAALSLLSSKQHSDGGWSTRDFSALQDWHFEISEYVTDLISHLPDAAKPESDAYMTALAIILMRQSDVPAKDERLQKAVTWLKREQRVSGRWWMQSLYRGNYHYITYIATCQALKALALCNELPTLGAE